MDLEVLLGEVLKGLGENESAVAILEASPCEPCRNGRPIELRARVELICPRLLDGSLAASDAAVPGGGAGSSSGMRRRARGRTRRDDTRCSSATRPDGAPSTRACGRRGRLHGAVSRVTRLHLVPFAVQWVHDRPDALALCESRLRSEGRHLERARISSCSRISVLSTPTSMGPVRPRRPPVSSFSSSERAAARHVRSRDLRIDRGTCRRLGRRGGDLESAAASARERPEARVACLLSRAARRGRSAEAIRRRPSNWPRRLDGCH